MNFGFNTIGVNFMGRMKKDKREGHLLLYNNWVTNCLKTIIGTLENEFLLYHKPRLTNIALRQSQKTNQLVIVTRIRQT